MTKAVKLLTLCEASLSKREQEAIMKMGKFMMEKEKKTKGFRQKLAKQREEAEKKRIVEVETNQPEWIKLEGQWILQVPGETIAALPVTGKKNSREFVIFDVNKREEMTRLKKNEVHGWLARYAITRKRELPI